VNQRGSADAPANPSGSECRQLKANSVALTTVAIPPHVRQGSFMEQAPFVECFAGDYT